MDKEFKFKEVDQEGEETLDVIAAAGKFNNWMYKTVGKHFHGRVLEIGSGIGNISKLVLNDHQDVTLSDIREGYCDRLRENFKDSDNLGSVLLMDLTDPEFETKFKDSLGTFDTVFALNVVEHIKDDSLAIANCYKLLKPNGHIVILVPAYQSLYNTFDKELEHYRRYTKKSLKKLISDQKFEIRKATYFNFIGIFGWWLSGKIQKNKTIPKGQMGLYNKLVPLFKIADYSVFKSMGLSTIVVGKKL